MVASIYVFYKWGQGIVMDAPQMLTPIASVAVVDIAQYAGKSGYDHKHGIFDNNIAQAAISGMSMGDVGSAVTQIAQAVKDQTTQEGVSENTNNNMAG